MKVSPQFKLHFLILESTYFNLVGVKLLDIYIKTLYYVKSLIVLTDFVYIFMFITKYK